jgi:hypothetical protein
MIHGDACFAYFNKIWGIPPAVSVGTLLRNLRKAAERSLKSFCFCASVTRLTQHYHFLP